VLTYVLYIFLLTVQYILLINNYVDSCVTPILIDCPIYFFN